MAQKIVDLPGIGEVVLAKRKGTRSLRLSIGADGRIRVGMPYWAPYQAGISFAISRSDWIKKHAPESRSGLLTEGMRVGKSYRLHFIRDDSIRGARSRLVANRIIIRTSIDPSRPEAQKRAAAACERALKKDAEKLLPQRVKELAAARGFDYGSVRVKRLRSRWGSCSNQKDITLNYYLIQLPWTLIDYVVLHELTHTMYLHHGSAFWDHLQSLMPEVKQHRKDIRQHKPVLTPQALA